ncbi:MAG: ATP synthase F0 subunit B [Nitrospiraceae bacterium]|nr:ATP synthase F0 subunit B [Nitrospiraceae bacterium]
MQIDWRWYFVLVINFIVLVPIMHVLLFKPFLNIIKERRSAVDGALEAARQMGVKREDQLVAMKRELELARAKSKELFEGLRAEGLDKQRQALAKAHEEAMKRTEKIKQELGVEVLKARQTLRAEAEKFSDGILEKLVKA